MLIQLFLRAITNEPSAALRPVVASKLLLVLKRLPAAQIVAAKRVSDMNPIQELTKVIAPPHFVILAKELVSHKT